jgi:hypothetical protein
LRLSSCRGTHPELTAVNLLVPPLDGPTQVDAGMPSTEYGAIGTSRPTLTDCAAGEGLGRRHRKVPYPMLPPIAWHGSADLNDAGGGAGDRWRHRRCGRWTSLRGAHIRGSSARSMMPLASCQRRTRATGVAIPHRPERAAGFRQVIVHRLIRLAGTARRFAQLD